jgi:hypothetical protein
MIIGDNFFITEMPKTGTTFLRNYFRQYKNIKITSHHDTVDENQKLNLSIKKFKVGTIRNPYLWYLSFWKWSCKEKKKSPLYSDIISRRIKIRRLKLNNNLPKYLFTQIFKDKNKLKLLFEDVNSKENFNLFLKILLNFEHRNNVSSDFSFIPHKKLGYMTYYFLIQNISKKYYRNLYNSDQKFTLILKNLDKKIDINYFFKTESLERDIKIFLKKVNLPIKKFGDLKKNSTSNNFNKSFKKFFTKENLELIEKKDAYLFKKFKYKKISTLKS